MIQTGSFSVSVGEDPSKVELLIPNFSRAILDLLAVVNQKTKAKLVPAKYHLFYYPQRDKVDVSGIGCAHGI